MSKVDPATKEQSQPTPAEVVDLNAASCYANFCRVTGTPEELIVDYGLNAQPMGSNNQPIEIKQRLVMNFFTAKRLLQALYVAIQRHEGVFGTIETDIRKRAVSTTPPEQTATSETSNPNA